MAERKTTGICVECRKEVDYELQKIVRTQTIRDKDYSMRITVAVCRECGEELNIPGLIDLNAREIDRQYREFENIITIDEIVKLMEVYHLGKAPLSLALGFGEVTISRYIDGQIPSKIYSDIMRKALRSPDYMEELVVQNRDKLGETAFKKAMKAIADLKKLFSAISDKMLESIAYIFDQMHEVTPLALQKILYFIQGIYMVFYQAPLYPEECQAWSHGPVYKKVYDLFKDFKYNPIDDNRFIFFSRRATALNEDEKKVLDLVIGSFGMYSGKILEKITHHEKPWLEARKGYEKEEPSNTIIEKSSMREYFEHVSTQYDIGTVGGINKYIHSMMQLD